MIYNAVSLKTVIGRIFNTYSIKSSNFVNKVPQWTGEALGKLDILMALEPAKTRVEVNDYKAILPSTLKTLVAVEYNGNLIPRLLGTRLEYITEDGLSGSHTELKLIQDIDYDEAGNIVSVRTSESQIPVGRDSEYNYILHKNGYIDLPFATGELVLYFKKLPEEQDETGMYFPLVPDNEFVLSAIEWYCLMQILYSGYKHPTLSLGSPNRYINPAMQWEHYMPIARNKAGSADRAQRDKHSLMWRAVVIDADKFKHSFATKIEE